VSTILKQIAIAFGAAIFIAVAVIGFIQNIPFFVIIFRGTIAMSVATIAFLIFALFFQQLLYRFVAAQIMTQKRRSSASAAAASSRLLGSSDGAETANEDAVGGGL
jgi:hypothetical protein